MSIKSLLDPRHILSKDINNALLKTCDRSEITETGNSTVD